MSLNSNSVSDMSGLIITGVGMMETLSGTHSLSERGETPTALLVDWIG